LTAPLNLAARAPPGSDTDAKPTPVAAAIMKRRRSMKTDIGVISDNFTSLGRPILISTK
jgi:hypothetical protein